MKTISYKTFAYFILLLILLTSCSSTKKLQSELVLLKTEIQKNDSLKTVVISSEIKDQLITPVVQSNSGNRVLDSLVNTKVDEILSKLNTQKLSGDNSYSLYYDKLTKQLEFYAKLAQSKNENTSVNKITKHTSVQKVPVMVKRPLTKLEKFLIVIGMLSLLFIGIKGFLFIRKKVML
jgi:hypothetical protein